MREQKGVIMAFITKFGSRSRITVLVGLVVVLAGVALFFVSSTVGAAAKPGFTDASLKGSYAPRGTGGANEAARIGVAVFDGAGKTSRSLLLPEAAPEGRAIISIKATGMYTVNPDGTGTAAFDNTLPDGSMVSFHFDFVVTRVAETASRGSFVWRDSLLGTEVFLMQREPGIAAQLVTFELTRLRGE